MRVPGGQSSRDDEDQVVAHVQTFEQVFAIGVGRLDCQQVVRRAIVADILPELDGDAGSARFAAGRLRAVAIRIIKDGVADLAAVVDAEVVILRLLPGGDDHDDRRRRRLIRRPFWRRYPGRSAAASAGL